MPDLVLGLDKRHPEIEEHIIQDGEYLWQYWERFVKPSRWPALETKLLNGTISYKECYRYLWLCRIPSLDNAILSSKNGIIYAHKYNLQPICMEFDMENPYNIPSEQLWTVYKKLGPVITDLWIIYAHLMGPYCVVDDSSEIENANLIKLYVEQSTNSYNLSQLLNKFWDSRLASSIIEKLEANEGHGSYAYALVIKNHNPTLQYSQLRNLYPILKKIEMNTAEAQYAVDVMKMTWNKCWFLHNDICTKKHLKSINDYRYIKML